MLTTVLQAILEVFKSVPLRVGLLVMLLNTATVLGLYVFFKSDIDKLRLATHIEKADVIVGIQKNAEETKNLMIELKRENSVLDAQIKIIIDLLKR